MLKSRLCDYRDAYILVTIAITVAEVGENETERRTRKERQERNKGVVINNEAWFTDYISEISNTQVDNAKGLDVVISMYNLIGQSDNYSKIP